MSERVKRLLPILKRINKLGDRAKRQYVKKCDKEFVDCVSECAKNVLRGNVPLTTNQRTKLGRNKIDQIVGDKEDFAKQETSDSTEGWFSRCTTNTHTVATGRSSDEFDKECNTLKSWHWSTPSCSNR